MTQALRQLGEEFYESFPHKDRFGNQFKRQWKLSNKVKAWVSSYNNGKQRKMIFNWMESHPELEIVETTSRNSRKSLVLNGYREWFNLCQRKQAQTDKGK